MKNAFTAENKCKLYKRRLYVPEASTIEKNMINAGGLKFLKWL